MTTANSSLYQRRTTKSSSSPTKINDHPPHTNSSTATPLITYAYTVVILSVTIMTAIAVHCIPVVVGYAIPMNRLGNKVEFCEAMEGTKVLNVSDPIFPDTPFGFCVPDCEDNEICAELHMPIFPNGSTPLSAGTVGKKCLNYPEYRQGVCVLMSLTVQPVPSLSTTVFLKNNRSTLIDLSIHCFDAPPLTTAVSTKCGAGKISRSLCRGFASIAYYVTSYPYLTALVKQCGIDLVGLLQSTERAPCGCSPPSVGVPMAFGIHYFLLDHGPNTFYGALLPNHVCLPSPQYVDTDNGCPGGHTWQLNTAPLGYYCELKTGSGDSSLDAVSISHCPANFRLKSVCGNTTNMHLIKGGENSKYGLPSGYHCAPTPPTWGYSHSPGW